MPKKKNSKKRIIEKKKNKKVIEIPSLEEEIKKESKIKKINEDTHDFIDEERFMEFMSMPEKSSSLVLNEVENAPQEIINLETNLEQSTNTKNKKEEEDSFKYNIGERANKDEPKYQNFEKDINQISNIPIESLGREEFSKQQEIGLVHAEEFETPQVNFEKYISAKTQNIEELGRNALHEKKDIKYRPSAR